jgi:hypothetical protein
VKSTLESASSPACDRYDRMTLDELRAEASRRGIGSGGGRRARLPLITLLRNDDDRRDRVPAQPLGEAVERVRRRQVPEAGLEGEGLHEAFYERLGVPERIVYRWRRGESTTVSLDQADRVLIALDLLWWDVYDESTVRRPLIEAHVVGFRRRAAYRGGPVRPYRERRGTRRYGDAGPDLEALERVRRAFEGDPEQVAA